MPKAARAASARQAFERYALRRMADERGLAMFVTAESFSADICRGLFTHYKREEDAMMESGKFDEELSRMSGIVDALTPNSLLLFNESFAATNEREGSEIARQIVRALLETRVRIYLCNTSV